VTSLRWAETGPGTGLVSTGEGAPLARYSWSADKNHPYFSDVRPLQHQGVVTNTAPWDHRWHHGLWWSWKFINGVLYCEDHEEYGGGEDGLGRSAVVEHSVDDADGELTIREDLTWSPVATGRPVLEERRSVRIHTSLDCVDGWALDWDSEWTATEPVTLSVTSYPEHWWGGYAGLNYRASRSMAAAETILASGGRTGREAVHSHPAEWGALLGNVDGTGIDEPNAPAFGGVALLVHPDNPMTPTPLYVFSAADEFGFLASAPLMHAPRELRAGETLRLRHRAVVLGAAVDHSALDRLSREYSGEETSNH